MSGGGGGGDPSGPAQPGMITLEDLESFSEEVSDSGNGSLEEEGETMEEDEGSDRLLQYWQDVARGHQVEVSQGKNNINTTREKRDIQRSFSCSFSWLTLTCLANV